MIELWEAATVSPEALVQHGTAVLCTLAFAGLLWRLIGRWTFSYPLARLVVGLFAILEFIVAMGAARRAAIGGPFNEVQWVVVVHAVATLLVVALWPRLRQYKFPEA